MITLDFEHESIVVDLAIVATGLGLDPPVVQDKMREGTITSLCERGIDEDAGRYRLTFFSRCRRFRVVVDENGNVLQRSALDFGDRDLPRSAHRASL